MLGRGAPRPYTQWVEGGSGERCSFRSYGKDIILRVIILLIALALAACNLQAAPATNISPDPTLGAPTPDTGPHIIGDTIPAGDGTCVLTADLDEVPVHAEPGEDTPVIATLGGGLSIYADEFNAGWWSLGWMAGAVETVGWVDGDLVTVEGACPQPAPA